MATPRTHEVDIIRLVALFGICMVNIPIMGVFDDGLLEPTLTPASQYAQLFISLFFEGKFILLFSFIFGWGIAIQERKITAAGHDFSNYYFRRTLGLVLIGLAHMAIIFSGDILVTYALTSVLFWFLRDFTLRTAVERYSLIMVGWNYLIIILFIIGLVILYLVSDGLGFLENLALSNQDLGGSFYEATQFRLKEGASTLFLSLLLFTFLTLGAFGLGYSAAHNDFFTENSRSFLKLKKAMPRLLVFGIVTNVIYAVALSEMISDFWLLPGIALWLVGAPALAAVYLYFLVIAARKIRVPEILVFAGRNSLSVYVLQGLIASLMFGGYGLGWFDKFGDLALIPISIGIYVASVLIVGLYAQRFGRGILEVVLRKISG